MPVAHHNTSKASAPLKCLQINLRHSRCAALNLSQLILDLDIDVILIQEPYAAMSPQSSSFEPKFVPPGYSSFHSLSSEHAFGSVIIAKSSLNASLCNYCPSNNCCGVKLSNDVFLFSIYCRPSLVSIPLHLESIFNSIPPAVKKHAIFGIDCNAKSPAWNSLRADKNGTDLEFCFLNNALSISNVNLNLLSHKPSNTSFVDVTLSGDSVSLGGWQYPAYPSLSDHPFISFSVINGRSTIPPAHPSVRLPSPLLCDLPLFLTNLEAALDIIDCPQTIQAFSSPTDIDTFIVSLTEAIKSAALKSKLPFHPSRAPSKMPWWSVNLWSLRKKLKDSYKLCRENPSQSNRDSYTRLKAEYQRSLRSAKKESWKSFCTKNLNGDIFGELKKLTISAPSNAHPTELIIDGVSLTDQKDILAAFSSHFFPSNPPDDAIHKAALNSSLSFCVAPLSPEENLVTLSDVKQAFDSVRLSKSAGSDCISSVWLSHCFETIKYHLVALFSSCLRLSHFPTCWKTASIVILKKSNKPNYLHPNCFRPISILNSLSKILEKVILAKLKCLAAAQNWFSPCQHGFRAGLSTESASLSLVKLIEDNKKKKTDHLLRILRHKISL
jgi:hypothetical protein